MRILPPKQPLVKLLGRGDFFLWEYYGEGVLGKIKAWIFRSRIRALVGFLWKVRPNLRMILDVGCGPMFISYTLTSDKNEYVGVDIISSDRLKKYRDVMNNMGVKRLHVVRAGAEQLPFKERVFDVVLALDVLEHLSKPRLAVMEIIRVMKNDGMFAISLPLENLIQKLCRIGFILMKIGGDPILKHARSVPITRTPEYHYVGDVKSYDDMIKMLKEFLIFTHSDYTPVGLHKSINVNAIHIAQKP